MAHAFAKIHVAAKQLGLDEDAQRDVYERVTGQRSLRAMNGPQIAAVNTEMVRLGFKPSRKAGRSRLQGQYVPILRALWMSAYNLGVVRNKKDQAMIAWVYRQTQIEHLNWLRHPEDAGKAIDAMKAWMRRESGCDILYTQSASNWQQWQRFNPGVQVIYCQHQILQRENITERGSLFTHLGSEKFEAMKAGDKATIIGIQNMFGALIRKFK